MEKHLAMLVKQDRIELQEAKKWANNMKVFLDAMREEG
jgi:hypothetical protein